MVFLQGQSPIGEHPPFLFVFVFPNDSISVLNYVVILMDDGKLG